jgi:hypothetical protein
MIQQLLDQLGSAYQLNLEHVPPGLEDVADTLIDLNAARWLDRPDRDGERRERPHRDAEPGFDPPPSAASVRVPSRRLRP